MSKLDGGNEMKKASKISRVGLFVELSQIVGMNKQLDGIPQSVGTSRGTAGLPDQPGQIMPQIRIVTFDGICICFSL